MLDLRSMFGHSAMSGMTEAARPSRHAEAGAQPGREPASVGRFDRGNVVVEFALALPVLLMLLLASAELGRFVLLNQKIDRVAVTMSDLVARAETISETDLDDIFDAAAHVAEPFDLGAEAA